MKKWLPLSAILAFAAVGIAYAQTGPGWMIYDSSGNLKVTSSGGAGGTVTTTPQAGTYTIAGCTVGVASASCIATSTVVNHVMIQNTSLTASIACKWTGGTAVLNSSGSVQLSPGQSALWGPTTSGVPSGAMDCIASGASTPLYVEYN